MKARNAARNSATRAISPGGSDGSILRPILFRLAADGTSAGGPGEQSRSSRLDDGGGPVPVGDELLDPISLDGPDDLLGDELRLGDELLQQPAAQAGSVREARRVDQARIDRVHGDPAARELDRDRAGKGELGVFGCAVGPGLPGGNCSRDGGDVHNVGGRSRLECRQECTQAPDRAEIVDADEPFDLLWLGVEKAAATRNPSIVDEQSDYGVALADGRGDAFDLRAVGDVAELVLSSDLVRDLA